MYSKVRIGAIAALTIGAGLAAWVYNATQQHGSVRPGSVVFSVNGNSIHRLSYRTDKLTLTARRATSGVKFSVTEEYQDGRTEQRCESAPDLAGLLPSLVEIKARRDIEPERVASEYPVQVGVLELEDEVKGEPIAPFAVRARSDRSAIAMVYQDTAFEAAIAPALFDRMAQGCAELGSKTLANEESRQ